MNSLIMYVKWLEIFKNTCVFFCFFLVGCKEEENSISFRIGNSSSEQLTVTTYFEGKETAFHTINVNQSAKICTYPDENFENYNPVLCQVDSIKFEFPNGRGYLTSAYRTTSYDFIAISPSFYPSQSAQYYTPDGQVYYFYVGREDYMNAHVLPE